VNVTFWGTRGSIATPGPETTSFGGDTACVAVSGPDPEHLVILDAGTGIRRLGAEIDRRVRRIDLLLSHLHLDHIVGIGFFEPLFRPDVSVSVWAPPSTAPLIERLGRYLSPPLFPVRLRDLACELELLDAPQAPVERGTFTISGIPVIHPDNAVGYRIACGGRTLAYLPDHEPALGPSFPLEPAWTSGATVADRVDLLIHDAQYAPDEYPERIGWGHSSTLQAVAFAELMGVRALALFHHDPWHDDDQVAALAQEALAAADGLTVVAARQGASITLDGGVPGIARASHDTA
jgi:phosphoribosyl 1,2-cyclic phosphodiesterase